MGVQKFISKSYQNEMKQYIKIILNSGLLLDEDLEAVQTQFNFNFDNESNHDRGLNLTAVFLGGFCLTSALFFIKTNHLWMFGVCSTLTLAVLSPEIKSYSNRIITRRNLGQIIENLRSILRLNRSILEYYKHRKSFGLTSDVNNCTAFTKQVKDLLSLVTDSETIFLDELRTGINTYSAFCPNLKDNFSYLNQIDFKTLLEFEIATIDDCINQHQKVNDIFILISSNYLTCLALVLCPSLWAGNKASNVAGEILNSVSKFHKSSWTCLSNSKQKFDETRFSLVRSKNTKIKVKDLGEYTEPKLHKSLLNSMTHTAMILEQSQNIFYKLQKFESGVQNLSGDLEDLRQQAFDYYQSLDILCRLYDVALNAPQKTIDFDKIDNKPIENPQQENNKPPEPQEIEDLNSEDEEYEVYITDNDKLSEPSNFNYEDEDESLKFVSLMTQELKHSLKTHSRFVKAREKRGIVEEPLHKKERQNQREGPLIEIITNPQGSINKALPILPPSPPPLPTLRDKNSSSDSGRQIVPSPPPIIPGPPPQPFHLFSEENREIVGDDDSFLKTLKAASSSRKIVEDIFGDDADDD